ncbi:DUF924 domain-containing protein [Aerococcus agrisoli]|uniref:DUF924 domain-containing protein n=1 Tax=Aerococcus agrisoli TaxID=2487350 RepID=A0A3N4GGP1_9LACT|nr:DUF924 family protein [Aerococcus agrisoli]RPA60968.1 DUF924 domain-containing protein [Aerococcus agrisoli]
MEYQDILDFWFEDLTSAQWFTKDVQLDAYIAAHFGDMHAAVTKGETYAWRATIQGRLAEIIVLDQFSRNLFRNDPRAYAYDGMALVLAQEACLQAEIHELPTVQRAFIYMPFMHSESLKIHQKAVEYFSKPGMESFLEAEKLHYQMLEAFGRYPHRNDVLARASTPEEIKYLKETTLHFEGH